MGAQTAIMRHQCDKAKALYMIGIPAKELAQRLGIETNTVRQWITRYGWAKEKSTTREAHTKVIDNIHAQTLSDVIVKHQAKVAKVYACQLDRLAETVAVTPREFVEIGTALKVFDDVGRRNLGLSDSGDALGKSQVFNFNLGQAGLPQKQVTIEAEIVKPIQSESHDTSRDNHTDSM